MALTTNLVSYYKFDSSNSNDSVGSNNGTDTAITYSSGNGKISVGAGFNGTTSLINLGSPASFDDMTEFTYSMWLNPTNFTNEMMVMGKNNRYIRCRTAGQAGMFDCIILYGTTNAGSTTSNRAMTAGAWNHIVMTYSESGDRKIHVYANGVECTYSTQTASAGTITSDASNNLYFSTYDGSYQPYLGAGDELGIWSRAITADEVKKLYNATRGNQYSFTDDITTSLVASYKLDESSGNASDDSGNAFTLTNNGTVGYSTGKINNGAVFNNTVGKNLDYNGAMLFVGSGGARSYSVWVNVSSFSATGYILDNTTTTGADRRFILYSDSDSKIHMYAGTNEVLTSALSTSTWYHIVVTQNGTTWELFLNGSSQGTTTMGTATFGDNSFRIGESFAGGGAGKSTNDIVAVWDRVITSTEIATLYNGGSGVQYPFSTSSSPTAGFLLLMV